MKWDDILDVLIELFKSSPGVKGVRLVNFEGKTIASTFINEMDETKIAAM
jgi:predicted regulator of Ras-like GTPase activity (Roadblock/LC7/MglB family)